MFLIRLNWRSFGIVQMKCNQVEEEITWNHHESTTTTTAAQKTSFAEQLNQLFALIYGIVSIGSEHRLSNNIYLSIIMKIALLIVQFLIISKYSMLNFKIEFTFGSGFTLYEWRKNLQFSRFPTISMDFVWINSRHWKTVVLIHSI